MDEQNNNQMPEQDPRIAQAEHTKQNTKDAIKLAEKGAATYFGGPEGAAVVNQLHNTPGIGKALDKVEDKAAEKLGKNRAVANLANKIGDSGMTNDANKALDIAGSTSGNAPNSGTTSSLSGGVQGANNAGGLGTSQSTSNGLGGIGGLGMPGGGSNQPPENGPEKSASENTIDGIKKTAKILKFIAPAMPIILTVVGFVLIAVILMSQIMMISDKISGAVTTTMEFSQRLVNFMTGDGWNTTEEKFFKRLKYAYQDYVSVDGSTLDIPLIASTIHYSKTIDVSVFDGEDNENFDDVGEDGMYSGSTIWGDIVNTNNTRAFYNVANIKLGVVGSVVPGTRGLLGHLVATYIGTKEVCVRHALKEWINFFGTLIDMSTTSFTEYKAAADGDTLAAITDMISAIFGDVAGLLSAPGEFVQRFIDFENQNQSYLDWLTRSAFYELKELVYFLTGDYQDEELLNSPLAYYKDLEGKSSEDGTFDIRKFIEEYIADWPIGVDSENRCLTVKVPYIYQELDYKSYYRYLVNVYVPVTYYPNMKLGEDYSYTDLIIAANEIFDQKHMYEYLVDDLLGVGFTSCGSCNYNITGVNTGNRVVKFGSSDSGMDLSNLKVRLLQCADGTRGAPIPGEELVDFEKYILGVVYAENGGGPAEAVKVQAIAARSFALTRPTQMGGYIKLEQENGQWILQIRNCVEDQVYCDPDRGCSLNSKTTGSNFVTVYSGENTHPVRYKGPLAADSELRKAVAEVEGVLALDSDGNVILTPYNSNAQNAWNSMANSGMDYTEIMLSHYGGTVAQISHSDCSNNCAATGDYTQWKQFGEPWSDIHLGSSSGTIGTIGCLITSVSIQIARSGVPVTVNPLNPGTVVQKLNQHGGFVNGGNFSWYSTVHVAPSFQFQFKRTLTGSKETRINTLNQLVSEGCYVVIEVKTHGGGQHWVALDYIANGEIYMMDPASSNTVLYNDPRYRANIAACFKVVK